MAKFERDDADGLADDTAPAPTTPSFTPTADDQANIDSLGGTDPWRLHDLMGDQ